MFLQTRFEIKNSIIMETANLNFGLILLIEELTDRLLKLEPIDLEGRLDIKVELLWATTINTDYVQKNEITEDTIQRLKKLKNNVDHILNLKNQTVH